MFPVGEQQAIPIPLLQCVRGSLRAHDSSSGESPQTWLGQAQEAQGTLACFIDPPALSFSLSFVEGAACEGRIHSAARTRRQIQIGLKVVYLCIRAILGVFETMFSFFGIRLWMNR